MHDFCTTTGQSHISYMSNRVAVKFRVFSVFFIHLFLFFSFSSASLKDSVSQATDSPRAAVVIQIAHPETCLLANA